MNEHTTTSITGLRTVGVPVSDQDRALEFYLDKLGLEKRVDAPVEELGGRWIEVAPAGVTTSIALVPTREGVPTGVETGIPAHHPGRSRGPCRPAGSGRRGGRVAALAGGAADVRGA